MHSDNATVLKGHGAVSRHSSAPAKIHILILDNHAVVRRGVQQILAEKFVHVDFGESDAGPEDFDLALVEPWDLAIVGIDLPGREGLDVLRRLKRSHPNQAMLAFTVCGDLRDAPGTVDATGKDEFEVAGTPDELVAAVRRVLLHGANGQFAKASEAPPSRERHRERPIHKNLSSRELEVLRLIGSGKSVKEIAAVLELSEKTVSTYRSRLLVKLELKTTADLIRYAVMNNLSV